MDGGEAGKSSMEGGADVPSGTEVELLRISGAQLFLVDGEESVQMGQGNFALIMMVQTHSPLATMVAEVTDIQWPVGKDGPVLKLANHRYTFAIPGLIYGVMFPRETPKDLIQTLESLVHQFCTYDVRPDIAEVAELSNLRLRCPPTADDLATDGVQYWSNVAEDVEQYSNSLAQQIKMGAISEAGAAAAVEYSPSWRISRSTGRCKSSKFSSSRATKVGEGLGDAGGGGGGSQGMSPRMRHRVDQARRMSAVVKLLSRTVVKGAISASGHVANLLGSAVSQPVRAYLSRSDAPREVAVASVDAFAKVAEAIETAGKSLASGTVSVGTDFVQQRYGEQMGQIAQEGLVAAGDMISCMWTLNKIGLRMLWGATASSIFLNAAAVAKPTNSNTSVSRRGNRRRVFSASTSPETSPQSFLTSTTVSTSSTLRPSSSMRMVRTRSIPSQSQLHQLFDDAVVDATGTTSSTAENILSCSNDSSSGGGYGAYSTGNRGLEMNERDTPVLQTTQLFPPSSTSLAAAAADRERDSSHHHHSINDAAAIYSSTVPSTTLSSPHLYMPHQLQHRSPPPSSNTFPTLHFGAYGPVYYHPIPLNHNSPFQHYSRPA